MRLYFDANGVMHITPDTMVEGMALKYWIAEYKAHGTKMLDIDTEPSTALPGSDHSPE